jgi:hypothetical protein
MGPAQVLRRLMANHGGATGREARGVTDVFPFCSQISGLSRKVFSLPWEMMGNQNFSTFSGI